MYKDPPSPLHESVTIYRHPDDNIIMGDSASIATSLACIGGAAIAIYVANGIDHYLEKQNRISLINVAEEMSAAKKNDKASFLYVLYMMLTVLQLVVYDPNDTLDIGMRGYLCIHTKVVYIGSKSIPGPLENQEHASFKELHVEASFSRGLENDFLVFLGCQMDTAKAKDILGSSGKFILCIGKETVLLAHDDKCVKLDTKNAFLALQRALDVCSLI
jgi:hypothetical protein